MNHNRTMSEVEHQKTFNLLNEANDCRFVTKKWNIAFDKSNTNYNLGNKIIFNIEVLKSNRDYNGVLI